MIMRVKNIYSTKHVFGLLCSVTNLESYDVHNGKFEK